MINRSIDILQIQKWPHTAKKHAAEIEVYEN